MTASRDDLVGLIHAEGLDVVPQRLGPLPLINHFLDRLEVPELLERFVPQPARRGALAHHKALGVLLRTLLVEREPIYQQGESARGFAPHALGLEPEEVRMVGDDIIGRALDRLFDADRAAMITEFVVHGAQKFRISLDELHNDSTSVKLTGQYRRARGRRLRQRRGLAINYGYSKDHRPDLKQLLLILTTTADGGVPVHFRCADGNTSDARTHIDTWEALRQATGRTDFLYVADSKLCTRDNMDYIDRQGGRFVTVLPRSRSEDEEFRRWIQTHKPAWERVRSRNNPRREDGPRDTWSVFRYPIPSRESFPVFWVWSTLLALNQEQSRRERLTRAHEDLEELQARLSGPRPRVRSAQEVERLAREILQRLDVERYVEFHVTERAEHSFRQVHRGRARSDTQFRRLSRRRLHLDWTLLPAMIAYDRKSDGMYPLISNDINLTGAQVLDAHKGQPRIEKRFSQLKSVHEIAPVFLKNEGRIEALFFLYFIALFTQAVIERELRLAMKRETIPELPIYPEERNSTQPTSEQVFRLFAHTDRYLLTAENWQLRRFAPRLTDLQRQILDLLRVPRRVYAAE